MRKKTNEEWLAEAKAIDDSYEWLEEYVDAKTKIKYRHKVCEYVGSIKPNDFLQGQRCSKCFGTPRKTNEQWLKQANKIDDDYEWLEPYKTALVEIKCRHKKCGNIFFIRPNSFINGRGCPVCGEIKRKSLKRRTNEQWIEKSKEISNDYEWLEQYKNSNTKIQYKHKACGYVGKILPSKFLAGEGCSNCSRKRAKETTLKKYGVEHISLINYSQRSIKILSSKENFKKYLQEQKEKLNTKQIAEDLQVNQNTINNKIKEYELRKYVDNNCSSAEKEIKEIFLQLNAKIRNILPNKQELDCYSEKDKLAVEYNGSYWHSVNENTNKKAKPQDYHDNKTRMCQELGIRLIHIWDFEWNTRQEQCIKLISNALNLNKEKVYARNCIIGYPTSLEYEKFMEKEHIQGSSKASIKIGLYYDNKLVMCCGIRNESNQYNLVRMASSINVIGGASRLAKHFPTDKSMVTFCDTGKFTGTVYPKMGFKKVGEVPPRYVWVNSQYDIKSRRACQKQYICETDDDWNKTEVEIMTEKGYYQCYGSHLDKYVREAGK